MATINPFDLLDDDAEDPSLIAAQKPVVSPPAAKKGSAQTQAKPAAPAAKLPSKPLPPSQAGQLLLFSFCLSIFFIFLLYVNFEIFLNILEIFNLLFLKANCLKPVTF
jgi:hypothetical protein